MTRYILILLFFVVSNCAITQTEKDNLYTITLNDSANDYNYLIVNLKKNYPKQTEFYNDFIYLIDSVKNEIYSKIKLQNEKLIVKRWFSFKTTYDTLGSLACEHHNKYLFNISKNNTLITTHKENKYHYIIYDKIFSFEDLDVKSLIDTVCITNDTLIDNFSDRALYFSKNNFSSIGECCYSGKISFKKYRTKDFANVLFNEFKKNKFYWNILIDDSYNSMAIHLFIDKETNRFWVTINVGFNKRINDVNKYHYDLSNLEIIEDFNSKSNKY
jgi:hypothetical protein